MKKQIVFPKSGDSFESLDHIHIFGPLTLDSRKNRAYIVPDAKFKLSQNEFDVLNMLAARENMTLTFEWLYRAIWDLGDGADRRKEALRCIETVINKINSRGTDFVWIDHQTPFTYTYRSKWGYNRNEWQEA